MGHPDGVILGHPGVKLGYPAIILSHLGDVFGHPEIIFSHSWVISGHPRMIFGNPYVYLGHPEFSGEPSRSCLYVFLLGQIQDIRLGQNPFSHFHSQLVINF